MNYTLNLIIAIANFIGCAWEKLGKPETILFSSGIVAAACYVQLSNGRLAMAFLLAVAALMLAAWSSSKANCAEDEE